MYSFFFYFLCLRAVYIFSGLFHGEMMNLKDLFGPSSALQRNIRVDREGIHDLWKSCCFQRCFSLWHRRCSINPSSYIWYVLKATRRAAVNCTWSERSTFLMFEGLWTYIGIWMLDAHIAGAITWKRLSNYCKKRLLVGIRTEAKRSWIHTGTATDCPEWTQQMLQVSFWDAIAWRSSRLLA